MNPNKLVLGLAAALGLLLTVLVWLQWQTNQALWLAIENLAEGGHRDRAVATTGKAPAGSRAGGSGRALDPVVEVGRLREEVNELRARTAALARLSVRTAEANSPPLNLLPSGAWKNAGRATPTAAAETLFWATDSGDVTALAGAISLDQAAREKAEAILARMSESVRSTYDTPEKLVALLLARETDIRAMQVLGESSAGDDAVVNLRLLKDDGKTKDEGMQFRRTADGWRMNVTGKVVDKMGKKLSEPPKKDGGKK